MMEYIYTYKMINEGLFRNKFLIIYQITNYKAKLDENGHEEIISEWKSPIYSYIQKAKTKKDASEIFSRNWHKLTNYRPSPSLEIISIQEIGDVSDKIHTY